MADERAAATGDRAAATGERSERRGGGLELSRRSLLSGAGLAGAALTGGASCDSGIRRGPSAPPGVLKLGLVSPRTGPLAAFGAVDDFVAGAVREWFATAPLRVGGRDVRVEIVVKDARSDPKHAAIVAGELIRRDQVDLILVSSTPDITNPVSDQCEAGGVPCVSTGVPWQPWFVGRGAVPGGSHFRWTYHFSWGLEDVEAVYQDMWVGALAGHQAGALFPDDPDGKAWGDPETGFAPVVARNGYRIAGAGRFAPGTRDYAPQLARLRAGRARILFGVLSAPDFATFWRQAARQGYRPRVATISKALLFPPEALGDLGHNLGTEVWWSPAHPYPSSLTGQTAAQLAGAYTAATGRQWTQPLGPAHALFEVATRAVSAAGVLGDKQAVATALQSLRLTTVAGPLDWTSGPVSNVARTPLVGGQWRRGGGPHPYELVVVSNPLRTAVPVAGELQPL